MKRRAIPLYCNEENGVMILKEDDPPILFEVTESNMVSAFWDYLNQTIQYRQFHSLCQNGGNPADPGADRRAFVRGINYKDKGGCTNERHH